MKKAGGLGNPFCNAEKNRRRVWNWPIRLRTLGTSTLGTSSGQGLIGFVFLGPEGGFIFIILYNI